MDTVGAPDRTRTSHARLSLAPEALAVARRGVRQVAARVTWRCKGRDLPRVHPGSVARSIGWVLRPLRLLKAAARPVHRLGGRFGNTIGPRPLAQLGPCSGHVPLRRRATSVTVRGLKARCRALRPSVSQRPVSLIGAARSTKRRGLDLPRCAGDHLPQSALTDRVHHDEHFRGLPRSKSCGARRVVVATPRGILSRQSAPTRDEAEQHNGWRSRMTTADVVA